MERKALFDLWETAASRSNQESKDLVDVLENSSDEAVLTIQVKPSKLSEEARRAIVWHADYLHLKEFDGSEGVMRDVWGDAKTGLPSRTREQPNRDPLNPIPTTEEIVMMRGRRKIAAIKQVRTRTGLGLKDAKDFVEKWQRRNP